MRIKVLITVMTYPLPSKTPLKEIVCTAGLNEDGEWVRLYPLDFRYRSYDEQFHKYQWIDIDVEKNKHDRRLETYTPVQGSEIIAGDRIGTPKGSWQARREIVLASGVSTMCELNDPKEKQKSLGIIRPREILDFVIEEDEREWKPEWQELFRTNRLFGPQQKPLEKIPYKFSYKYLCESPDCREHTQMIADWELGELYRKERSRQNSEKRACDQVREKFLVRMCAPNRDPYFYVGTVHGRRSWIILGVFWPPRQMGLF